MPERFTIAKLIDIFNEKYAGRYSYSIHEYYNTTTIINAICPDHGAFQVAAGQHLNGVGCKECQRSGKHDAVIYIIKSDQEEDGIPVYKIGVTSGERDRFKQLQKEAPFKLFPYIRVNIGSGAYDLENMLLKIGGSNLYRGFDGATEYRSLTCAELDLCISIIDRFILNIKRNDEKK